MKLAKTMGYMILLKFCVMAEIFPKGDNVDPAMSIDEVVGTVGAKKGNTDSEMNNSQLPRGAPKFLEEINALKDKDQGSFYLVFDLVSEPTETVKQSYDSIGKNAMLIKSMVQEVFEVNYEKSTGYKPLVVEKFIILKSTNYTYEKVFDLNYLLAIKCEFERGNQPTTSKSMATGIMKDDDPIRFTEKTELPRKNLYDVNPCAWFVANLPELTTIDEVDIFFNNHCEIMKDKLPDWEPEKVFKLKEQISLNDIQLEINEDVKIDFGNYGLNDKENNWLCQSEVNNPLVWSLLPEMNYLYDKIVKKYKTISLDDGNRKTIYSIFNYLVNDIPTCEICEFMLKKSTGFMAMNNPYADFLLQHVNAHRFNLRVLLIRVLELLKIETREQRVAYLNTILILSKVHYTCRIHIELSFVIMFIFGDEYVKETSSYLRVILESVNEKTLDDIASSPLIKPGESNDFVTEIYNNYREMIDTSKSDYKGLRNSNSSDISNINNFLNVYCNRNNTILLKVNTSRTVNHAFDVDTEVNFGMLSELWNRSLLFQMWAEKGEQNKLLNKKGKAAANSSEEESGREFPKGYKNEDACTSELEEGI